MTEQLVWVTIGVLVIFIIDWLAVRNSWRKVEYGLKPAALVAIIIWTLFASKGLFSPLIYLLILAQISGLIGDVFLLLNSRWFILGLCAFLIGHLLYIGLIGWGIIVVCSHFGVRNNIFLPLIVTTLAFILMLIVFYRIIAPKSPHLTLPGRLWASMQVYGWVLGGLVAMSLLSVMIANIYSYSMLYLPIGAILFFISDSILAYDRFNKKIPRIRVWIMMSYHLAQFSLAVGFTNMWGSFFKQIQL